MRGAFGIEKLQKNCDICNFIKYFVNFRGASLTRARARAIMEAYRDYRAERDGLLRTQKEDLFMKSYKLKHLSLLLAGLILAGSLVACANSGETGAPVGTAGDATDTAAAESETVDAAQAALDALEVSYGGRELAILGETPYCSELLEGEDDMSEVMNEAIHKRNTLFTEKCDLTYAIVNRDSGALQTLVRNEASAPTGEFQFIDTAMGTNAAMATSNLLYNMKEMNVDISGPWWDTGTADFELNGGVYFMTGSINTDDDHFTFVLMFNKDMQKTYANTVPNPYDTVRAWEWTLDHFHSITAGISQDNGDGKWDDKDTYGLATIGDLASAFFIGSNLRFVLNDESVEEPTLFLNEKSQMEKALHVIDTARKLYNENNTTLLEDGVNDTFNAFLESRALFYGHVSGLLSSVNASMVGDFGVLPIPKYDKAQELYHSYILGIGSSFSVINSIPDADVDTVGDLLEAFAILSHQHVRPVYYDTIVTSRNVRDPDSAEMLDILFQNRVYDMAMYFDLGMGSLVSNSVINDNDAFNSSYTKAAKVFGKRLNKLLAKLD